MDRPPPLDALMFDYYDGLLELHLGERLLNKIFARATQAHALGRIVVMHFEGLAGTGEPPTLARLQRQIGYSRTLASFVALLRVAKLVTVEPDALDQRVKRLVPTPRVIDGLRQWLAEHLRCCEALGLAEPGTARRLLRDDALFAHYVRHARHILENLTRRYPEFPLVEWFQERECGDRIALALLREHCRIVIRDGSPPPPAAAERWFRLASSRIAADLGISKSHVRNVMNDAEKRGVLRQDAAHHAVALTPAFVSEAQAWFVDSFVLFAETLRRALADMRRDDAIAENAAV